MVKKKHSINKQKIVKHRVNILLFCLLFIQPFIWLETKQYLPELGILAQVPSKQESMIYTLGDEQFYFRYLALSLQNSGDSFGRFTALKDYDYALLAKWLMLIDELDVRSKFLPSIASYYYSNTAKLSDLYYIINYLEYCYDKDPQTNWWWLGQATIIALQKLKDKDLSLRLAFKLSNTSAELPRWAQQMPAIVSANFGERQLALEIMKDLANRYDDYSQSELNFMNHFIRNRLGFLRENIDKKATKQDNDQTLP